MQAVTIRPEWGFAIAALGCRVVSKDYKPEALLGSGTRIALHAGKHVGGKPGRPAALRGMSALASAAALYRLNGIALIPSESEEAVFMAVRKINQPNGVLLGTEDFPRNEVFGVAELDTPRGLHEFTWAIPGMEHWRIRNLHILDQPVQCSGHGGIWTLPADVAEQVEQQDSTRTTP